ALNRVFADTDVVVTGIKGHTGHTGAASGAMSIMSGIRAMEVGQVPGIAGTITADPAIRFDVAIGEPRRMRVDCFQVNSFGFGGQNASVIVTREPGR
ncbi:MAG: beta-ketoacyl-[acyl-carrier-protein] synthase family protein, partial [Actinomycetota bacterium]